jgi:hypothetical protein
LARGAAALAAITVTVVGLTPARAAPKGKAAKEDFFFQEEPGEGGKRCGTCNNFQPTVGDKGTCSVVEGEVCKTCYCQAWAAKK